MHRSFDYKTASEAEIVELANELPGLSLGDIPGSAFESRAPQRGRAEAGHAIEAYFGIPRNSRREADFPAAGVELKSVALVETSLGLRADQRTVISQINYQKLAIESWSDASVRKKLRLLLVFFERLRDAPKQSWLIRHFTLWAPDHVGLAAIESDWNRVRDKVLAGLAHELTEADGRVLGPCTKGASGKDTRVQPFSEVPAKPRAWALKQSFTLGIYEESRSSTPDYALIVELAGLHRLMSGMKAFVGSTINDVADEVGRTRSGAKNYAASVVRAAVDVIEPPGARSSGAFPQIKSARTSELGVPYEAVSFPAFKHLELVEERWEESTLLSYLEHVLFIPVVGSLKATPQGECVVGTPLYWRPNAEQLEGISVEWHRYRDLIENGDADRLPTARQTRYIHVRPHARNAADRDAAPGGSHIKKSFWLNKPFVAEILASVFPTAV